MTPIDPAPAMYEIPEAMLAEFCKRRTSPAAPVGRTAVLVGETSPLGENSHPMTTRRNHYVPVWHQKGFVSADPPRLFYLARSGTPIAGEHRAKPPSR
jgi:hypothetical protein